MNVLFLQKTLLNPLTDRDLAWLGMLHRHGPLSSEILFEATRPTHRCKDSALRRLQHLRKHDWLSLPVQQQRVPKADFNPFVYDLTPRTQQILRAQGAPYHVRPTGHWAHLSAVAAITATIEIAVCRAGHNFIPASTILALKSTTLPIPLSRGRLIPDQLFAIRTSEGFRAYLLELDRGTEPYVSSASRKSLARSLDYYREAFTSSVARQHYGLKAPLSALWMFTSGSRAEGFKALLAETQSPIFCAHETISLEIGHDAPRWKEIYPGIASLFVAGSNIERNLNMDRTPTSGRSWTKNQR